MPPTDQWPNVQKIAKLFKYLLVSNLKEKVKSVGKVTNFMFLKNSPEFSSIITKNELILDLDFKSPRFLTDFQKIWGGGSGSIFQPSPESPDIRYTLYREGYLVFNLGGWNETTQFSKLSLNKFSKINTNIWGGGILPSLSPLVEPPLPV